MPSWLHSFVAGSIGLAVLLLFSQTFTYPFLSWDDQDVFVRNAAWHAPRFAVWAFTTTYIEHYQPLAWLTWGAVDRAWGLTPSAAHALNVGLHAMCAVLVFALALRLCGRAAAAALAALLFALHPLRVEVVAWASAMPYALALLFALLSTLAFLDARGRRPMIGLSIALYATSLLARPIALGLPAVLSGIRSAGLSGPRSAALPFDKLRAPRARRGVKGPPYDGEAGRKAALLRYMALAVAAAYVESKARLTASLAEVSAGARLTLALTAPFRYLWRTLVPVNLTPLDPLAVTPHADVTLIVASAITLAAISWMAWRWRGPYPGMAAAWLSYIALLVPAVGLVPSGLQATADRYTYLAAVPVSIDVPSRSIRRTHAQAALGMALVQIGRTSHAMPYLREAIRQGAAEPSVPNALAFSLVKEGRAREACDVLEAARARFPGDANVARNLAQLSAECGKP